MNPFLDQKTFMQACGQTVDQFNPDQFNLYLDLITEESQELADAITNHNQVEALDALIDILVVTIVAIHSMGADGEGAWQEVMRTNMAKIDSKNWDICSMYLLGTAQNSSISTENNGQFNRR